MKTKLKKDSRGLSLLELVISIAILAILSAMLTQLVIVGSRMYRKQQTEVALQTNSQIIIGTIAEYVQDCTKMPVIVDNEKTDTLTIKNTSVADGRNITFSLDGDELKLTQNDKPLPNDHILMKGVTIFDVTSSGKTVTVNFSLKVWGRTEEYTTVIYMRNWANEQF
jgi:prepilin-type N-terminal cleavage/methylation domain-containing protein